MATQNNFLDVGETIVRHAIVEAGYSFSELEQADPVKLLRRWNKCYRGARNTAFTVAGSGGVAVATGFLVGAVPLAWIGIAVVALASFLGHHHNNGVETTQAEADILARIRPIIEMCALLEERGASPSHLVDAYDMVIKSAIANDRAVSPQQLVEAFEGQVATHQALARFVERNGNGWNGTTDEPSVPTPQLPSVQDTQAIVGLGGDTTQTSPAARSTRSTHHPVKYLIGDRLRTALITAVSGGGKDILLSNAVRELFRTYPDFRVLILDCKDDPKEYGYYGNLPNVQVYRLNVAIASDGEVVEWVDRCLEEFVHLPEKALLICNEGTLIRAKSKRYVQVIDGLVSSGDSRQKYAWEAGQSAHTDDLGINGAARSRFRMLIVGLRGEEMQIEAVLAAKFVAESARNMSDIKTQLLRSPVHRAWSDGQAWYAMPKLTNYSGYDRDSRSMLPGFKPQDTRAQLEQFYSGEELPTFPVSLEGGKEHSENLEGAGRSEEVDFQRSDDWRKYFPEAPVEVEQVVFRAYSASLETGKRKQDFIAEFLRGGSGGRRYQAASKYLDYLAERFGRDNAG